MAEELSKLQQQITNLEQEKQSGLMRLRIEVTLYWQTIMYSLY